MTRKTSLRTIRRNRAKRFDRFVQALTVTVYMTGAAAVATGLIAFGSTL
ncbi:hypothetical protein NKJ28_00245 [Mesorhizobium sp. M0145]